MAKDMRTPLRRARYLGAAHDGTEHWWRQRLTAVALIPLAILFVGGVITLMGADYAEAVAFLSSPWVAMIALAFLAVGFYHLKLGLQVIIEDYVHHEGTKLTLLVLNSLICYGLAIVAIFSLLRVSFGGPIA
jgi:succinate dehydrogenase / fumarate reductase membrane anchor subunit